jgi:enoyl-CoA hydratase/carnithine racemase
MASDPPILMYRVQDRKAYITLNRPTSLNAFSAQLRDETRKAFLRFGDDDDALVCIFTGEGGRAFSVGADLKELSGRLNATPAASGAPRLRLGGVAGSPRQGLGDMFDAIETCPKPIIAAIDGYCLAAGFECALLSDIRLATEGSVFGLPEPKRSLLAGPGLINLSRVIPLGEALRYQLTGAHMPAERAYQVGLVQALAANREALSEAAEDIADEILECAPLAVQYIKQIVRVGRNLPIEYSWKYSEMFWAAVWQSEDVKEGPLAFAEKRKPKWKMR